MITKFIAQNYSGTFEEVSGEYTITGSLSCDADKRISRLSGSIGTPEEASISFAADRRGEGFSYSFYNVTDLTKMDAVSAALSSATLSLISEISSIE